MFELRRACAATSWDSAGRVRPLREPAVDIAMEELIMKSASAQYDGGSMGGENEESKVDRMVVRVVTGSSERRRSYPPESTRSERAELGPESPNNVPQNGVDSVQHVGCEE